MIFNQIQKTSDILRRVLKYVDGVLYVTTEGRWALRALNPGDSYTKEVTQEAYTEFKFNRKTWSQVYNRFHATFIDEDENFSQRVVIADNPAAMRLAGHDYR